MMHIKDHKLQILPFAPAHLAGVERLEQLCFAHPWQRVDLEAQLTSPCARFLVAVLGDKVVGYLGVQVVCGEGSVTNVAVDPTYRRRGIARALFGACFAAGEMDFLTLEVRPSNEAALALYRELGFQPVGRRRDFYTDPTEDALLLTKIFKKEEPDG